VKATHTSPAKTRIASRRCPDGEPQLGKKDITVPKKTGCSGARENWDFLRARTPKSFRRRWRNP